MSNECCPNDYCANMQSPESRKIVEGLNIYLANLNVLNVKLHNIHWNVVGAGFFEMHKKTQELYEFASEELDRVAERIKMFGCYPLASMQEYVQVSSIKELSCKDISSTRAAKVIMEDLCMMLKLVKKIDCLLKETSDSCTGSLLSGAMCFYEKYIWFLGAYLTRCQ